MIESYANKTVELFHINGITPKQWEAFASIALRKLDMIKAAVELKDLEAPPGNRLEKLKGKRAHQHSIRINGQWRVCFEWNKGACNVEIVDYH